MITPLRFGTNSTLRLELPDGALVAFCDAPRGEPVLRLGEAVDRALGQPLDFPSPAQAALPGDKVVLALEQGVPQAGVIVERIVAALLAVGVDAADIALLRTRADGEASQGDPLGSVPGEMRHVIRSKIHDLHCRDALSYLAATAHGKPIYIDRAIHDADLVISIGCLRLEESLGYHGIHASVFPTFSDAASIDRYRSPKAAEAGRRKRLAREADEVCWLLGLRFTVQVVPGAQDAILHVLAGDSQAVRRVGRRLCDEAWRYVVPRRAALVVATIEGDESQQTWDNVGRALSAASWAVAEGGDVALCTSLRERPGPAVQQIIGADDLDHVLRGLDKRPAADMLPASELVHALQRGRVYLVSQLDDELVEELGISPVAAEQFSRLTARYDSCTILANAQRAVAHVESEAPQQSPARPKSRK